MGSLGQTLLVQERQWSTKGNNEKVNLTRQDSDDMVVMATVADEHIESKIWFLNSGSSNHMTGRKVWLVDFDESKNNKVKLDDNSSLQVEGTINIVIQTSNGEKALIKDILYVHGVKWNLLSVGQLVENGFSMVMKDRALKLFDIQNNLVLKSPSLKNRTF